MAELMGRSQGHIPKKLNSTRSLLQWSNQTNQQHYRHPDGSAFLPLTLPLVEQKGKGKFSMNESITLSPVYPGERMRTAQYLRLEDVARGLGPFTETAAAAKHYHSGMKVSPSQLPAMPKSER